MTKINMKITHPKCHWNLPGANKLSTSKFSISYRGPVLWNKIISIGINPETAEAIFTKFLKKFIINSGIIWDWH